MRFLRSINLTHLWVDHISGDVGRAGGWKTWLPTRHLAVALPTTHWKRPPFNKWRTENAKAATNQHRHHKSFLAIRQNWEKNKLKKKKTCVICGRLTSPTFELKFWVAGANDGGRVGEANQEKSGSFCFFWKEMNDLTYRNGKFSSMSPAVHIWAAGCWSRPGEKQIFSSNVEDVTHRMNKYGANYEHVIGQLTMQTASNDALFNVIFD